MAMDPNYERQRRLIEEATLGTVRARAKHAEEDRLAAEQGRADAKKNFNASEADRWPWGSYETKHLRMLAAAVKELWIRYVPGEPDTAPTNQQVIDWLVKRNVTQYVAEVMATIIRADGLKPGPRKQASGVPRTNGT